MKYFTIAIIVSNLNIISVQRQPIDFSQQFYPQPRPLRSVVPGCAVCLQQRNYENQSLKSCCFCGAYMEHKQRCFITSNNSSIRHSTVSRFNATQLQTFTYTTSSDNHYGTSTTSVNSSPTIHSSFKVDFYILFKIIIID